MALESAALGVGKSVATLGFRAWLAARAARAERDAELTELIRLSFRDQVAQRRVKRQLADIGDSVGERLLKLCGHEYGGLTARDKAAVLTEVKATLTAADLTDSALFAADLDAGRLAARIRGSLPARGRPAQLGEAGARLYEVALEECCDCLVRIVITLPQFPGRADAEILGRLTGLAELVGSVLARLPARSLEPVGAAGDGAFTRRYLELVSDTLDAVELFGVRVDNYRPRTPLSVAYISLTVTADDRGRRPDMPRPGRAGRLDGMGTIADWRGREPAGESTVRVETALARGRRVLLRGEAGSGKSTLLRWLAVTAARGAFTGDLADWNGCVPLLVKLRTHAERGLPPPERMLEGVADAIIGMKPDGWAGRLLDTGRALLLVDGVDELAGRQRREVRPWLARLLAAYPGLRVIVTSRPAAASVDWLADERFAAVHLERMRPQDVRELIRHWHQAISAAPDLPCPPDRLPGYENALLARLEAAPHLRTLAANPLLAAMLCALNLDRSTQLPRDRMGLYAAVLDLLLEHRDAKRDIPSYLAVSLERAQKVQILQGIAVRLSETNRVEIPKSVALRLVAGRTENMPRVSASPAAILEHLLERSGVIREPVTDRVDFVHRTVQEYLTARQLADDGDMDLLIRYAHRDQWHETIVMAAGHANGPLRGALLEGILRRIRTETQHARRLKLLLASCLETLPAVPRELRSEIDACLIDLIPPRSHTAARSLATAGEEILDRLPPTLAGLTPAAARATVRTAWMINGPRALDVLARYRLDPRHEVQEELIEGWAYFDPDEYARRVLADAPLIRDGLLSVRAPGQLAAVQHVKALRSIEVHPSARAPSLAFLAMCPPLQEISVWDAADGDLRPLLPHAGTLARLNVSLWVAAENAHLLARFSALRALLMSAAKIGTTLDFLRDLPHLTYLTLGSLTEVSDFSPLAALTSLESLNLHDCPVEDIEDLPLPPGLTALWLHRSPLTCGLDALIDRVPHLTRIDLHGSRWVDDLTPLRRLRLSNLGLWDCPAVTDLSPLEGQPRLHTLDLEGTQVSDLVPLARLPGLSRLWLANCPVRDLTPLRDLRELRYLHLNGVPPGVDLSPLAENRRVKVHIYRGQEVRNATSLGRRLIEIDRPDSS